MWATTGWDGGLWQSQVCMLGQTGPGHPLQRGRCDSQLRRALQVCRELSESRQDQDSSQGVTGRLRICAELVQSLSC